MSRKLLAFLVSELKTVRVICRRQGCGAVTEVSVEQLGLRFERNPCCPVCRHDLLANGRAEALGQLSDAILNLQGKAAASVEVEFVLPDPCN